MDLERVELEQEEYDVVLCMNVLEHAREPLALLKHVGNGLKSGGTLVVKGARRSRSARRRSASVAERPLHRSLVGSKVRDLPTRAAVHVGWRWRILVGLTRVTTLGLLTAEDTGIIAVFSKMPLG
jgi:2-polyprenyl-3-methyl-5-hydroxy-6-metoxy-1,4-benzoquinol methylase